MSKGSLSQGVIIGIIVGVVSIWGIYWLLAFKGFPGWVERGQFGDMFGGLNALFSGLAFAGVIIAIILQKEELGLQREEMKRFADAQEKSEQALNRQAETLKTTAELNAINSFITNYEQILRELTTAQKNETVLEEAKEFQKRIGNVIALRKKVLIDLENYIGETEKG